MVVVKWGARVGREGGLLSIRLLMSVGWVGDTRLSISIYCRPPRALPMPYRSLNLYYKQIQRGQTSNLHPSGVFYIHPFSLSSHSTSYIGWQTDLCSCGTVTPQYIWSSCNESLGAVTRGSHFRSRSVQTMHVPALDKWRHLERKTPSQLSVCSVFLKTPSKLSTKEANVLPF